MADYELNIDSLIQRLLEGENRQFVCCVKDDLFTFALKVFFYSMKSNKKKLHIAVD